MFRSSYHTGKPYIPQGMSEIWDFLGAMMLTAPTFKDKTGYFPERNIDTEFFALNEGLKTIRKRVDEEKFEALIALSDRMKTHFEADPEGKTEDSKKGRECMKEMEDILRAARRRKAG